MINDVQTNYPEANMSDEDFGEIYNSFNMTQNVTESVTGDVLQGEIDDTGVIGSITKGSFKALKQVRLMFGVARDIAVAIQQKIGIPEFIIEIGLMLMVLGVIFAIIFLVMGIGQRV